MSLSLFTYTVLSYFIRIKYLPNCQTRYSRYTIKLPAYYVIRYTDTYNECSRAVRVYIRWAIVRTRMIWEPWVCSRVRPILYIIYYTVYTFDENVVNARDSNDIGMMQFPAVGKSAPFVHHDSAHCDYSYNIRPRI